MFDNVLMVCTGNICRSPLAEALWRGAFPTPLNGGSPQVASAGISALVGAAAEANVQRLALRDGVDLAAHLARQLEPAMTRAADLILVMEPHHLRHVMQLDATARGKTFLLGHWSGTGIPDPYRRAEENYLFTHGRIAEAVRSWLVRL
jgi:protein-tyrosine phosphatase